MQLKESELVPLVARVTKRPEVQCSGVVRTSAERVIWTVILEMTVLESLEVL